MSDDGVQDRLARLESRLQAQGHRIVGLEHDVESTSEDDPGLRKQVAALNYRVAAMESIWKRVVSFVCAVGAGVLTALWSK